MARDIQEQRKNARPTVLWYAGRRPQLPNNRTRARQAGWISEMGESLPFCTFGSRITSIVMSNDEEAERGYPVTGWGKVIPWLIPFFYGVAAGPLVTGVVERWFPNISRYLMLVALFIAMFLSRDSLNDLPFVNRLNVLVGRQKPFIQIGLWLAIVLLSLGLFMLLGPA